MDFWLKNIIFYLLTNAIIAYGIPVNNVFNTPTAINPEKGSYQIDFNLYHSGGIGVKASVSLSKYLQLGLIEYIDNIIGSGQVTFNPPGVLGRISFTGQGEEGYNVAIGWDILNTGSFSEFPSLVSGPYLTMSKGFFLISQSPHIVTVGSKVTVTSQPHRIYMFTSILFRFFSFLEWGMEIDNIPLYEGAKYHFINNQILGFNITENLTLKLIFQIAVNFDTISDVAFEQINSRNISFNYQNFF